MKQSVDNMAALKIKIVQDRITKKEASFFDKTPEGISLIAVRSFCRSISASTIRLNPIAPDLAATIATSIQKKSDKEGG